MATLKDVAERAGVSIASVSYCINGTRSLNPETRARINAAIAELNYIPNSQARNLKIRVSKELCAIFPDLENLCYTEMLKGMLYEAENCGYTLNISCSYNNVSKEQQLIQNAISNKYAGLLLLTCQPQNTDFFKDTLIRHNMETVFLDRMPQSLNVIYYGFDNYGTVNYLTKRLLTVHYTNLLLMTGPDTLFSEQECISGFEDAIDRSPENTIKNILTTDTTKEGAFKVSLQTWVSDPPQAIITTSQSICQGVIEACNVANLRIPEDICILTLDVDTWNRSSFFPNIIRTNRQAYSMGIQACRSVIRAAEKSPIPETGFHILRDSIMEYPLSLPVPRNLDYEPSDPTIATLRIACVDIPTMHALDAVRLQFMNQYHIRLYFEMMELKDLLKLIPEDSHKETPSYDVYLFDTSWFSYLLQTGSLKDLTDDIYSNTEMRHYLIRKNLENCTSNKRFYGYPIVGGTQFLLYRKDLFTDPALQQEYKKNHKLSLRPPRTWKEFNTIARFFTREFNPSSPTTYGTAIPTNLNEELILEFEPRLWAQGGDFYDAEGHLCLNTPENIRALSNFTESFRYSLPGAPASQDVFNHFTQGDIAMCLCYTEYATQIQNSTHMEYLHRCGYSMIPGQIPVNVGWHFGVSPNCRKMPYVVRFFNWLHQRHSSYFTSIINGASALKYPYENHELKRIYPWIELTPDALESCRSRIYPIKAGNTLIPPNAFEAVICDELRTFPQTPKDVAHCLDRMQHNLIEKFFE